MNEKEEKILQEMSWNTPSETQQNAINKALKHENISFLMQPIMYKSSWENCAKVISQKSEKELKPYLNELLKWIQDLNWPGALEILKVLRNISWENKKKEYEKTINIALEKGDFIWIFNLGFVTNDILYKDYFE